MCQTQRHHVLHVRQRSTQSQWNTAISRLKKVKVKASRTRHRALGPELIPVYRQSACKWPKVIHPAVGCHYFPPGLRLRPQPQSITALWPVPSYTAWWQRHIGVNNLPKVVTQRCLEQDLNPLPTDHKPNCLTCCTTAPPLYQDYTVSSVQYLSMFSLINTGNIIKTKSFPLASSTFLVITIKNIVSCQAANRRNSVPQKYIPLA